MPDADIFENEGHRAHWADEDMCRAVEHLKDFAAELQSGHGYNWHVVECHSVKMLDEAVSAESNDPEPSGCPYYLLSCLCAQNDIDEILWDDLHCRPKYWIFAD